jgi:hypothetical protein
MTKGKQTRKPSAAKRTRVSPVKPVAMPPVASGKASATPLSAPKVTDLANDYRYVLSDLKRLGILAAASFATLIILALLIR